MSNDKVILRKLAQEYMQAANECKEKNNVSMMLIN